MGIRTSFNPFGVNFTNSVEPPTNILNGNYTNIIYSTGTYVAVAAGQTAGAYSTNGTNWFDMVLPGKAKLNCLACGVSPTNGPKPVFVVIIDNDATGDSLAWSLDGINWTLLALPVNNFDCVSLASDGTNFYGIQNASRWSLFGNLLYNSSSGYYFRVSTGYYNFTQLGLVAINNKVGGNVGGDMVIITDSSNDYFYYLDAVQGLVDSDILPVSAVFKHVAGSKDRWYAVGTSVNNTVLKSTNGKTWTVDYSATSSSKNRICGGVEGTSARFLTVNGTKYFDVFNAYGWTTLAATNKMNDVCWDGTNFVTCGNNGNNKLAVNIIPPNIT